MVGQSTPEQRLQAAEEQLKRLDQRLYELECRLDGRMRNGERAGGGIEDRLRRLELQLTRAGGS